MRVTTIMGAVAGDTIGSVYEFNPTRQYDFPLLTQAMEYTVDSIVTLAVAEWILDDPSLSRKRLIESMQRWGRRYPHPMGAYGGMFSRWLNTEEPEPYNSWGNGSAMRVSPVGFAFDTLEETLRVAEISAAVSHNHPEGIKGAQAVAAAIFLARTGKTKEEIRAYVENTFGYDLSKTCDEIRRTYGFDPSCQGTVPQSIVAFLESNDFEDAIRLTVSLGGDADTMGAITGAIAAAYYGGVPEKIYEFCAQKLPEDLYEVLKKFDEKYIEKR